MVSAYGRPSAGPYSSSISTFSATLARSASSRFSYQSLNSSLASTSQAMGIVFPMGDIPSMEYRLQGWMCLRLRNQRQVPSKIGGPLLKSLCQQIVRNANGVGNNSQRRIDRTCRNKAGSIHNIKIIQIMGLAVRVKHT